MQTADKMAKLMPGGEALASIHQAIATYNSSRTDAENVAWRNALIYLGAFGAVCLTGLYFILRSAPRELYGESGFWALAGGLAFIGYSLWKKAWQPVRQFQQSTKARLVPVICGFVENLRYSHETTPSFMPWLPAAALVQHSRIAHDDLISGHHEGMDFELGEVVFWIKSGKNSEKKTFEGAIFHCRAIIDFAGVLIVSKRSSWGEWFNIGNRATGPLIEVPCANKQIAETYEFHSDNPVAAAALVNGPMTSVILWLAEHWPDGVARIALSGQHIFILVPSKTNHFELPEIHVRLDYERHVAPMTGQLFKLVSTGKLIRGILS